MQEDKVLSIFVWKIGNLSHQVQNNEDKISLRDMANCSAPSLPDL